MSTAKHLDAIVIGAGPAGLSAAVEADALGLSVMLIDEQDHAGGQVYRWNGVVPDRGPGAAMRSRLAESGVRTAFGHRCWHVGADRSVRCIGPAGQIDFTTDALIVATGASERVTPVTGWTRPGVIGLAAATILLKSEGLLPGRNVVVAGCGPLLLFVAARIWAGGGRVAAIIDRNGPLDWLACARAALTSPLLGAEGAAWAASVLMRRTPIYFNSRILSADGADALDSVTITSTDGSGAESVIRCDTLCYGDGLAPSTEMTRLLGAGHAFDAALGGWHVGTDVWCRTSVERVYACGDGAGIRGAAAAPIHGRIAALAAARDLGRLDEATFLARARRLIDRSRRVSRFGRAMTGLTIAGLGAPLDIGSETICRCESVSGREIEAAIEAGATSVNAVKAATRCGMGPCGGRYCTFSLARILAGRLGQPLDQVSPGTARPPLRPMPIGMLMGDFAYSDIPFREPAPL